MQRLIDKNSLLRRSVGGCSKLSRGRSQSRHLRNFVNTAENPDPRENGMTFKIYDFPEAVYYENPKIKPHVDPRTLTPENYK